MANQETVQSAVKAAVARCIEDPMYIFQADKELFSVPEKFPVVVETLMGMFGVPCESGSSKISEPRAAGIFLYDLVRYSWSSNITPDVAEKVQQMLLSYSNEDYHMRSLQARILGRMLSSEFPSILGFLDNVLEQMSAAQEAHQVDMHLTALITFVERVDDERSMKQFAQFVPKILPALFTAFTNDEVTAKGREKVLQVLHLCLRTVSWADGIDNELVDSCLSDTFNSWMALFIQLIQTNPKTFFDIKRNALMCLTVIFRDYINYSRECINMILKPAWKLLNFHLPVFTEVLGYN